MGARDKRSQNENMGAKSEPGTARLYHILVENAMGAGDKTWVQNRSRADLLSFLKVVQKYAHITGLTPEIMHELIGKIIVHAPL